MIVGVLMVGKGFLINKQGIIKKRKKVFLPSRLLALHHKRSPGGFFGPWVGLGLGLVSGCIMSKTFLIRLLPRYSPCPLPDSCPMFFPLRPSCNKPARIAIATASTAPKKRLDPEGGENAPVIHDIPFQIFSPKS